MLQFHHGLAPPSADLRGHWNRCSFNPAACNANQIDVLQGSNQVPLEFINDFSYLQTSALLLLQ